ncbi:DNA-binding protein [Plesiocystis pacifica SIR-1]|uniref:DNA-binding protein n=1 Tax=Plesiocystis pacifica SIR-1 TaxID=391625 RepID=A6FXS4_9BACT|nr:helix-turn-helix transcriptional regulator [Plesiocystis pacifica]EDM81662.1 DNA-binding protein [Plesiocystis pacifica SIR-1]
MPEHVERPALDRKKLFAKRLRRLRANLGLTQEELAERSELSADTIRRLEGSKFNPSLETLHKIAAGLEMSTGLLLDEERDAVDQLAEFIRRLPAVQQRMAFAVIYSLHHSVLMEG